MNDTTHTLDAHSGSAADDRLKIKILGMDCGSCAMTIEDSIRKLDGVREASVSFTTETMEVVGTVEMAAIASRLKELGYAVASPEPQIFANLPERRGALGFVRFMWQQPALRRALCIATAVVLGLVTLPGTAPVMGFDPLTLLLVAAVLSAGAPVFLQGFRALIIAHRITIDLLMAIATVGALAIGEHGEAVTVILLFMLGEGLEAYSAERARDSLRSLMALQPQQATVLQSHPDTDSDPCDQHDADHSSCCSDHDDPTAATATHAHAMEVPVDQVNVGDRLLVRPGQRIPVDAIVIKGLSYVDQAPVTGESVPVVKTVDDRVMAGTVNGEAALEIRCTNIAAEGTIARIARLVEQAQSQRSPAERFIDRFARWYTPLVVALATLVVIIPVYGFAQPLMTTGDTTGWLYRGLAMLIIACPCALVISIPVTVVSGLTHLANRGILVKGGAQLDRLADVSTIAFDKTGTLTYGKPRVTGIRTPNCSHPAAHDQSCRSCDNVLTIAAAVEHSSEHPIACAIVESAHNRLGINELTTAYSVQAHPGKGVSGELPGNKKISVGTGDLFDSTMLGWNETEPHAQAARDKGETVMYVAENNKVIGYIGVLDEIRETSHAALAELGKMHIRTIMLTGDHLKAATRVAEKLTTIDDVQAQLMPEDKLTAIETIRAQYGVVAMVGDGINDAPALARADIGIAMGAGGTAQAMETADIVLMQDNLHDIALALRIARKARRIVKQNIFLSLLLKVVFLALAVPGLATLWMAVLADVGATLLVTLNGMRLLREK